MGLDGDGKDERMIGNQYIQLPHLAVSTKWEMDVGMTCNFMSFSTVFQSFQEDEWVIMKGYMC